MKRFAWIAVIILTLALIAACGAAPAAPPAAPAAVTASMLKSIDPKNAEMILERFPLKRFGDPEKDIAPLVVFLCGPASGYMTGNTVSVDGGVAMVV